MSSRTLDPTTILASTLLALFGGFWTYWSFGELYYEGWGLPFPQPLVYLIPCAAALSLAAATLRWPRAMGGGIVLLSVVFYAWVLSLNLTRWGFSWRLVLGWTGTVGVAVLAGVLFMIAGARAARRGGAAEEVIKPWWVRHLSALIVFGIPMVIAASVTASELPKVLGRVDDGGRGVRIIEGNGVHLAWASAGPGWNWRQPWGGYPSWDSLAFYGVMPIGLKSSREIGARHASGEDMRRTGLCGYLDVGGTTLLAEPTHLWRMPTHDELVRSLTRRGASAGCVWNGERGPSSCRTRPQKETPLWAPDEPPVYMWTGSERTHEQAWFVNYLGFVSSQPKGFGNPRHGYRCVKPVP
jgi:hypothetical protein